MIFVWTLSDVLWLAFMAITIIVLLYLFVPPWIKQMFCKHDGGVGETSACDAICSKCGKNLGFIGAWRKQNPRRKD